MTAAALPRADFLRNLPAATFCPPEGQVAAAGLPATADALARQTDDTRAAVDEFAGRYWSLPPAERRAEWGRLAARPADAPTMAFLAHLKGGLAVGPAPAADGDPALADLGAITRELFTLRPRQRSARRMAWLDTREPSVNWQEAVGRLWAADADAAELDPLLVGFLDDETPPPTSVETFTPPSLHSVNSPAFGRAYTVDSEEAGRRGYRPRRRERESATESSGGSPWAGRLGIGGAITVILILARIAFGCMGGLSKSPSNSPSYSPSYTPSYTIPTDTYTPPTRLGGAFPRPVGQPASFTSNQVTDFRIYESLKRGQPPARYDEWVRAGRPAAGVPIR